MRIKHIILFVTLRCDSNCVMCFNNKTNFLERNELTLEEYHKIASNIKKKLKSIMISGGEPSLREDLPEICKVFNEHCGVDKIHIPFNGHDKRRTIQTVRRIIELCPNTALNIAFSIDGIGNVHDAQRGTPGSFKRVIDTYQETFDFVKDNNKVKIGITTVVTKLNFKQLGEFIDYVFNLKKQPDYHSIMLCRIQYGSSIDSALLLSPKEYIDLLDLSNRHQLFYCKKIHGSIILGLIRYSYHRILNHIYLNANINRRIIECKAQEFMRVIDADGAVRICESKSPEGNIRDCDYSLEKMDIMLGLSRKKFKCVCTHPCFIVPSLQYPSNIIKACISLLSGKKYLKTAGKTRE
ncbi:MAG: radical SAM protein [Candidatus Omnitrophota bacterium]